MVYLGLVLKTSKIWPQRGGEILGYIWRIYGIPYGSHMGSHMGFILDMGSHLGSLMDPIWDPIWDPWAQILGPRPGPGPKCARAPCPTQRVPGPGAHFGPGSGLWPNIWAHGSHMGSHIGSHMGSIWDPKWNPIWDPIWNPYGIPYEVQYGIPYRIPYGIPYGVQYGIPYVCLISGLRYMYMSFARCLASEERSSMAVHFLRFQEPP